MLIRGPVSSFARPLPALLALALLSCSQRAPSAPAPRFGDLMTQVGRRFELLGRAAVAKRWELAAFELDELRETFEDAPTAVMPADVKANLPQLVKTFLPSIVSGLDAAVAKRDPAALVTAFASAAQACNGCHQEAGKPYIEIPLKPGETVPKLDPLP
jgi:cytochrome c553